MLTSWLYLRKPKNKIANTDTKDSNEENSSEREDKDDFVAIALKETGNFANSYANYFLQLYNLSELK